MLSKSLWITLIVKIRKKQLGFLGYFMRKEVMENITHIGFITGRKGKLNM